MYTDRLSLYNSSYRRKTDLGLGIEHERIKEGSKVENSEFDFARLQQSEEKRKSQVF